MKRGIEIVSAKIEIAEREEGFTGWIIALPNDIEHMAPDALRKIHREAVGVAIQHGITQQGELLEVGPFDRLRGIIGVFGDINFEAAGGVRDIRREARIVAARLDFGSGPIHTRQVETGIFGATRAGELTVGNQIAVVALGHEQADLVPIVKSLGPGDGDSCFSGIARRRHGILKKDLMHAADRVAHGSMGEAGDARDKEEDRGEKEFHKSKR